MRENASNVLGSRGIHGNIREKQWEQISKLFPAGKVVERIVEE